MELREWQKEALIKIRSGFMDGHKNQIVCSATGSGKSILALTLIRKCLDKGKRACFMVDRKTIVNQTSFVADSMGLQDHSVMMAQHPRFDPSKRLQICSIQTIARRGWPEADLYVIDEVHTLTTAWTQKVKECKGAVIGLSATPFSKLGDYFSNLINVITMKDLVEDKILVPMKIYSCTQVNMKGAETRNGEWSDRAVAERGHDIIGDVVSDWIKYGEGRKTIVFGANIAHCEEMCGAFNEAGISARMFTSYTKDEERIELLDEFKKEDSTIKLLITVEALAKGFDNPLVSCICDVRPLRKSFSTAVQMWGRMLRCSSGKENSILLDFSGNIVRFGNDFEDLYNNGLSKLSDGQSLDQTIRKEKKDKEHKCPKCGFIPFFKMCMSCGHMVSVNSKVEHTEGVMKEITLKTNIATKNLYDQCFSFCSYSGNNDTTLQRAAHLYKSMTGEFPKYKDPPELVEVSKKVENQYKYNIIKYHKGAKGN